MHILIAILSSVLIAVILWDAFEAIVLPRRVTRRIRLTRLFYQLTWQPIAAIARRQPSGKRRERYLSVYGPLSLLLLLIWALGLIFGFAMLYWSLGTRLNVPSEATTLGTYVRC